VSTCRCHYPGGIVGSDRSWDGLFHPFPCSPTTTAFPTPLAGRLPHRCLSRLAQHSLTLRPADSLHRRAAHLSRRLRRLRYLRRHSDSFRPERPSWPGGTCTHWETPPFTAHNGEAARLPGPPCGCRPSRPICSAGRHRPGTGPIRTTAGTRGRRLPQAPAILADLRRGSERSSWVAEGLPGGGCEIRHRG
jgi:hypothetical protein